MIFLELFDAARINNAIQSKSNDNFTALKDVKKVLLGGSSSAFYFTNYNYIFKKTKLIK